MLTSSLFGDVGAVIGSKAFSSDNEEDAFERKKIIQLKNTIKKTITNYVADSLLRT